MNCQEWRERINATNAGSDPDQQDPLCAHLNTCPDCQVWLSREIEAPPPGLTPPAWDELPPLLTGRLRQHLVDLTSPDRPPGQNEPSPTVPQPATPPDSMFFSFSQGLRLGLAFGILFILMTSLSRLFSPAVPPLRLPLSDVRYSFLPPSPAIKDVSFLEALPEHVTERDDEASKSWTFLELDPDSTFTFLTEEEQVWFDDSHG